ncbi:unnamed protein product [marine sediment metagenome]|uniref:Glycosyl transferase family 3 N-terminal domain-containing protein n=1 Tax=marine sediment metagenome TaxID=412755 RepID=X1SPN8_9ZZZZ
MNVKQMLAKFDKNIRLSIDEAESLMDYIMTSATDKEIKIFLTRMNPKEVTAEELAGMAISMKKSMISINPKVKGHLHDCCGTGGGGIVINKQEP